MAMKRYKWSTQIIGRCNIYENNNMTVEFGGQIIPIVFGKELNFTNKTKRQAAAYAPMDSSHKRPVRRNGRSGNYYQRQSDLMIRFMLLSWFSLSVMVRPQWRTPVIFHTMTSCIVQNNDVMVWQLFPHCCSFYEGIHWTPADSPHIWLVMPSFDVYFLLSRSNCWTNNWVVGDLWPHGAHVTPQLCRRNTVYCNIEWIV